MSINISSFARQIAAQLDKTDKDGSNGKIDKDKWNSFAKGKGNSIQKYIRLDAATKSISVYLRKEAQKSGNDVKDIGQKWLNCEECPDIEKNLTLDEVIVTGSKAKKGPSQLFQQPDFTLQASTEINISIPEDLAALPATKDDKASVQDKSSIAVQTVQETEPEEIDNDLAVEPEESDKEEIENFVAGNQKYQQSLYNMQITMALTSLRVYWAQLNNNNELFAKIGYALSKIPSDNMTTATIVKVLKDELYTDLQKVFNYNTIKISQFIYVTANQVASLASQKDNTGTRSDIVTTAQAYFEANIKSQAEGNVFFSGNHRRAWCADTVSTILVESLGDQLPSNFRKTSSVSELRNWGKRNEIYHETSTMSRIYRQNYIANNIKPGDIMIEKRNKKSHTGIVVEVAEDGSWFRTIEGNASRSVATRLYSSNSKTLSGFISMDRYTGNEPNTK